MRLLNIFLPQIMCKDSSDRLHENNVFILDAISNCVCHGIFGTKHF